MRWISVGLLLLFVGACSRDGDPPDPSTPTPSATILPVTTPTYQPPEGVSIASPTSVEEALAQATPPRLLVLDRATGLVRALGWAIPHTSQPCTDWRDNDTLLVCIPGGRVFLDLDGRVSPAPPFDPPADEFDSARRLGGLSASGEWRVAQLASGAGGVIVAREQPGDLSPDWRVRVGEADYYLWSPTQDTLALLGNRCRGFDLFVLDPESEALTNLTVSFDAIVLFFIWEPGGSRISAPVTEFGATRGSIVSFDAATGQHETLISLDGDVLLNPVAWNPAGTHLLIQVGSVPKLCGDDTQYRETYLDPVPNFGGP